MSARALLLGLLVVVTGAVAVADEQVGRRPYEMDEAGRVEDVRPPLVDFEDLTGWTVVTEDAEASLAASREQQLWGRRVGRVAYRGTGPGARVELRPPRPMPLPPGADSVDLWVYGNNWDFHRDPTTPQVDLYAHFVGVGGRDVRVRLDRVRWRSWWLVHRRFSAATRVALGDRPALAGFEITGATNRDERVLYLDNLSVYTEPLPPLVFEPRPRRNLDLPTGQTVGTNTGPGRLPIPTRPETILPTSLQPDARVGIEREGKGFAFHYRGSDGHLVYRYVPRTGTLDDVEASWEDAPTLRPLAGGGVRFVRAGQPASVQEDRATLVRCARVGDQVEAVWTCTWGERSAEVGYTFRLWGKSLVVDVACAGGHVGAFRLGRLEGLRAPRAVAVPYLTGQLAGRGPAVAVGGTPERPLFALALVDAYRSNASALVFEGRLDDEGAVVGGGSRYDPLTDGSRNPCFERIFLTISPRFEEVLPNIPNPRSPWIHVAGKRLFTSRGAVDREADLALWTRIARYGMTKVVVTDHESGWRDGGESYTFRTRAAPGKGGDAGQVETARAMRALGFRYGIYNNYADFAPVNGHWDPDAVTRVSDGNWRSAWPRCYSAKPSRAVELEAALAPVIQQKFQLDAGYLDVHTGFTPWHYVDYDARVPGAGTFAATYYAWGEIMLHQREVWNGPVYSEGGVHWHYAGLTDGNYGQDRSLDLEAGGWLVDFDLRKLHPLCCNAGMGSPQMFFRDGRGLGSTNAEQSARLDRFLAATLAFGHTGFLVGPAAIEHTVRSYFAVQPLHARYAGQEVDTIRYADGEGQLVDVSTALARGVWRRSQIVVRYADGLEVVVNGHASEAWRTHGEVLPPNGWLVRDPYKRELVARSALLDGRRADYVDSPDFAYADGRGRFVRFGQAASDGPLIVHKQKDGTREVIPVGPCSAFAASLGGRAADAVALDEAGRRIGAAETRFARGLVHVEPVSGAFSYVLSPVARPALVLTSERDLVVPGEDVRVRGRQMHVFRVPADAAPAARIWKQFDGAWIDFTVLPLVEVVVEAGDDVEVALTSRAPAVARIVLDGQTRSADLQPGVRTTVSLPLAASEKERVGALEVVVDAGDVHWQRTWWLHTRRREPDPVFLPRAFLQGVRLRGGEEEIRSAGVHFADASCGGERKRSLRMHPPYEGGVGQVFARFEDVDLGSWKDPVFRGLVGKGDGSTPGDGIVFRVVVIDDTGARRQVAETHVGTHAWKPLEADLSPWVGRQVDLQVIADPGPDDNTYGDWACWADLRVEYDADVVETLVLDEKPRR